MNGLYLLSHSSFYYSTNNTWDGIFLTFDGPWLVLFFGVVRWGWLKCIVNH